MSITVMQQALEFIDSVKVHPTQIAARDSLHDALRTAIEQAEKQEAAERYIHEYRSKPHPGDFGIPRGHWWQAKQYADVLYTTPPAAQPAPVQEPVGNVVLRDGLATLVMNRDIKSTDQRLYTTPPAAQPAPVQEPLAHLWECLGRWSAYLVDNGAQANCAPPAWLVDAVKNATTPPAQPAPEFECPRCGHCCPQR
jgi:hypothetical protein